MVNDIKTKHNDISSQSEHLKQEIQNKTGNSDFGKALQIFRAEKNEDKKLNLEILQIGAKIGKTNKKIDQIEAKSDILQSKSSRYNEISQELIDLYDVQENERTSSPNLLKLSFLISRLSSSCLQLLRIFFPFPSKQAIYSHFNQPLAELIENLKNGEISKMQHPTITRSLSSPNKIHIVLAIDAILCCNY